MNQTYLAIHAVELIKYFFNVAGLADLVLYYFEQVRKLFSGFLIFFMYHDYLIDPKQNLHCEIQITVKKN